MEYKIKHKKWDRKFELKKKKGYSPYCSKIVDVP